MSFSIFFWYLYFRDYELIKYYFQLFIYQSVLFLSEKGLLFLVLIFYVFSYDIGSLRQDGLIISTTTSTSTSTTTNLPTVVSSLPCCQSQYRMDQRMMCMTPAAFSFLQFCPLFLFSFFYFLGHPRARLSDRRTDR